MHLPFTTEQFFEVFRQYNIGVWPVQVLLIILGVAAFIAVMLRRSWSGIAVSFILALLWMWLAVAYHFAYFAAINPLAYVFGVVSLAGAAALIRGGVVQRRLTFSIARDARSVAGVLLVAFALIAYPAWSWLAGHRYPAMPTFGLPCPTTIFTIGMLSFLVAPYPRSVLVVPVAWSFVGAQAAFLLSVSQDLALVVAGAVGLVLMVRAKPS